MNLSLSMGAALLLSLSATAQNVLHVGAGGYADVGEALEMAHSGDEIVVAPGSYPPFVLQKGVTIRAEVPGSVEFLQGFFILWSLPAGDTARLVGVKLRGITLFAGNYSFEDCEFRGNPTVMTILDCNAVFERCSLFPAQTALALWPILQLDGATVSMTDCVLHGTSATVLGAGQSTLGLRNGALLFGSGLVVTGGLPGHPAPAMTVDATSQVRLTDSTLTSNGNLCAIVGNTVVCERCVVSPACASYAGEPLLGIASSGVLQLGQPYTLTFRGEPNQPVLVFGSHDIDSTDSALLRLPFLLSAATCFPAAMLVTDAHGAATVTWFIASGPVPTATGLWFQAVAGTSFPLAASAVVGGIVR